MKPPRDRVTVNGKLTPKGVNLTKAGKPVSNNLPGEMFRVKTSQANTVYECENVKM